MLSSLGSAANALSLPIILQPPTNLSAFAVSTSQINLYWNAPSDLGSLVVTGYEIQRSTNGGSWGVIVPSTGSTSTAYSDTGLSPSTSYTYRVYAITILVTSSPSNTATATTLTPVTVPQPPTGLGATADSASQITLNWNSPSNNGGSAITGYKIERSTDSGSTWSVLVSNTGSTATTYSNTGLASSTTYTYRVSAINSVGNSSPSNVASATTLVVITSPQPPTGLTATATSSSQIDLSWNAPGSDGGSAITGYKIERSINGGTFSILVANTADAATAYSDTGLTSNTNYTYRISAINSVGTSSPSNTASATTPVTITAPQPPTGLAATAISSSQINLSWSAPANNGGSAITGYKIERSTDSGSTWSTISPNTGSTTTTFSDTSLAQNTAYTYQVSAINSVGTSSPSDTATATTFVQVHSITLAQPGLVVSDSLTNETMTKDQLLANQQFWRYGGSATVNNTPYDISRDPQGFHIGVQAANDGNWTGFYGVAPSSNAVLFHAVITTPVESVPTTNDFYENGLYVQTSTQNVNYVTCFADTGTAGTEWAIVSATGNANGATNFNLLWVDQSPNQPLTRDCTMITNGSNYLKVYLDGTMVYTSNTLDLQMPGQLIAFLEPQTSYAGQMLYGTYKDYYSTTDENIKIVNNPANAVRVDIVSPDGTVIASGTVNSGTAT
ncbi:MAG TPA: fibronectin type III domain-containing protein, partial [Candidatus Nitrosotalea sp.]|nr:fibronectin type III domain-containing protein [Candidatus Nitrosotalea sp.]